MAKLSSKYGPSRPEDRRGTRSHRAYAKYSKTDDSMAAMLATPRQLNKALKLAELGVDTHRVQGRVIRAVVRMLYNAQAREADDQMGYGI